MSDIRLSKPYRKYNLNLRRNRPLAYVRLMIWWDLIPDHNNCTCCHATCEWQETQLVWSKIKSQLCHYYLLAQRIKIQGSTWTGKLKEDCLQVQLDQQSAGCQLAARPHSDWDGSSAGLGLTISWLSAMPGAVLALDKTLDSSSRSIRLPGKGDWRLLAGIAGSWRASATGNSKFHWKTLIPCSQQSCQAWDSQLHTRFLKIQAAVSPRSGRLPWSCLSPNFYMLSSIGQLQHATNFI